MTDPVSTTRLAVLNGPRVCDVEAVWALRGMTTYKRYSQRNEQEALDAKQLPPGRLEATRAALIPITESHAWWLLAQDECSELLDGTSHHITIGLEYLPAVARER